jgi:hypothetical protein
LQTYLENPDGVNPGTLGADGVEQGQETLRGIPVEGRGEVVESASGNPLVLEVDTGEPERNLERAL